MQLKQVLTVSLGHSAHIRSPLPALAHLEEGMFLCLQPQPRVRPEVSWLPLPVSPWLHQLGGRLCGSRHHHRAASGHSTRWPDGLGGSGRLCWTSAATDGTRRTSEPQLQPDERDSFRPRHGPERRGLRPPSPISDSSQTTTEARFS